MSLPFFTNSKCAVCGKESEQITLASTNTFGSPDLDLRPPEMKRSTMCWWIQECPHCGYISESIDDETDVDKDFLQSVEYISCSGKVFASELAQKFYKYYLINLLDENEEDAFYAVLHASWACDDAEDIDNAVYCRKLAIVEIEKLIKETDNPTLLVQKTDLLRRAGLFQLVINDYGNINFDDELLNQIIAFEIEKSVQEDMNCYTVADATQNQPE